MNNIQEQIYKSGKVKDGEGSFRDLHSQMSKEECLSIEKIIRENSFNSAVEVGCAYGLSSLSICEAISESKDPEYIAIDPYQSRDWDGIGRRNIKKSGYKFANIVEEPSEVVLPKLMDEGRKFDFALIDGMHTFDHAMVDLFYINRILKLGGIVVIDDMHMKSVNRAVRYFLNYPAYEMYEMKGMNPRWESNKAKMISRVIKYVGLGGAERVIRKSFLERDFDLGIQYSMAALKKVKEDNRGWDWFVEF